MAQNMTEIAAAMKLWLENNVEDYPTVATTLQDPATAQSIAACEASIGTDFPQALKDLLAVFDGQHYDENTYEFPCSPWSRILGCKDITRLAKSMDQICEMCQGNWNGVECVWDCKVAVDHVPNFENPAGMPALGHNDHWIPFAESYSGGGGPPVVWLLDMDPPAGVPTGRVLAFGGEGDALSLVAPSLTLLMEDVLRVMHQRSPPVDGSAGEPAHVPQAVETRHRKVCHDDGPRIWHQYQPNT